MENLTLPLCGFGQALKMFYDARPPGIYKPDYIDALYTFYHEIKPESVTCPPTPEWKRSTELDLNGEVVQDDDDDGDDAPAVPIQVSLVVQNCKSLSVILTLLELLIFPFLPVLLF